LATSKGETRTLRGQRNKNLQVISRTKREEGGEIRVSNEGASISPSGAKLGKGERGPLKEKTSP